MANFYGTYPVTGGSGGGGGGGTVTSVDVSGGVTGLTTSGGPIVTAGTITIGGTLNAAHGGTGATSVGNLTDAGTDGIVVTGGTGAVIGTGTSLAQHVADTTHNGYLASTDWNTFNGKQAAGSYITALTGDVSATGPGSASATLIATTNATLTTLSALSLPASQLTGTSNLTDAGTDGIIVTGGTGAVIGAGTSISQHVADTTHNGYLASVDWNTFNGKQPAGSYITALTGDVTAIGPGSSAASLVATTNSTLTTLSALSLPASQLTGTSNLTDVGTDGITVTGGTGAVIGAGTSISQHVADTTHNGYLSSTDWNTFNSKQTATLTNTHLLVGNVSNVATDVAASGDLTLANTGAFTFNTVNANIGTFGDASHISQVTLNAKGLTTAGSSISIQIAESQVTNLVSDLAAKQSTTLTNTHILVGNVSNVATDVAMSGDVNIANTGATSLVATTNSTITTLSALSLPASQLTGTGNLTDVGTDGITVTGGTGAVIGSGTSLSQHVADTTHNGYLASIDWNTFNGKQAAGNYITALTGDVTASGPGSSAATLAATTNATLTTLSGLTTASSLASVGTITTGTWNGTTIAINHGGTGQTTAAAAYNALSPMTTTGDIEYESGTNTAARLAVGSTGQVLTVTGGVPVWAAATGGLSSPSDIKNYGFTAAIGSNALTLTLVNNAAATPSAGSPVTVAFRDATSANGDYVLVSAVAATSIVISSGASLGLPSAENCYFYVYALNNAGTFELAVSAQKFDDASIQSTTGMSGTATSDTILYSTTARTSVGIHLIGRIQVNETTAGTWASTPLEISLGDKFLTGYTPTILDDVTATKQGVKAYSHGTNYNGGNAPTITLTAGGGTLSSVIASYFIPYQMQDTSWRMRFNLVVTLSSALRGDVQLTINGITFKNISGFDQAVACAYSGSLAILQCYAIPGGSVINMDIASGTLGSLYWSGDVLLDSKPTWAY